MEQSEIDELRVKAKAWDVAYPALIFLSQTGMLPSAGLEDIRRAVDSYSRSGTEE